MLEGSKCPQSTCLHSERHPEALIGASECHNDRLSLSRQKRNRGHFRSREEAEFRQDSLEANRLMPRSTPQRSQCASR